LSGGQPSSASDGLFAGGIIASIVAVALLQLVVVYWLVTMLRRHA